MVEAILKAVAFRNLFISVIVGGIVGVVISLATKKSSTAQDALWGILGAFLAVILTTMARGGIPVVNPVSALLIQVVGASLTVLIVHAFGKKS